MQKQWQQANTLIKVLDSLVEEDPSVLPPAPQIRHLPKLEPRSTDAVVETAVEAADSNRS